MLLLPQAATRNPGPDIERGRDTPADHPGETEEEGGAGGGGERLERRRRAADMVARDVEARLGAMAVHAMGRFGAAAAPVLAERRKRFPDRPLLFALA